ncbi:uncharacterized protein LOC125663761 isoform X2 [Ostrea edulis]|uniref:uncharacterized protein LOC125663761 isoform X2 n=1 Tax=Ostrea edulis TaxID=37623 RepID=UPI0024AEB3AF|nr:uncharacterized protein LOC125663761 isoform X2 [Ostrea edulis]
MVVVQATPVPAIIPHPTTSTNFYDEVISEGFGLPGCFDECGSDGGGLVFAYNSSTVRLWANSYGKIISILGWGWPFSDFNSTLVRVRILAWYFEPDPQKCLQNSTSKTNLYSNTNIHTPSFEILGSDLFLVLAKVRIQDGENKGFTFYGSGSVVLSGRHGGGIVFGYNERGEVFTWRRLNSTGDSMLKMESPWGDGQRNQIFKHVEVELTVFPLNRTTCGNPLCEEGNSTLVFQNFTTAVYECRPGYVNQSGDLVKYCDGTPEWRGAKNQPVNCIKIKSCTEPPEEEGHATLLHYADHVNGTAVYACVGSFSLREGNLTKTCTDDLEWQGIPILCTEDDQQLSV